MSVLSPGVSDWLNKVWGAMRGPSIHSQYREIYKKYPDVIKDLASKSEFIAGKSYAKSDREAAIIEGKQEMFRHIVAMGTADDVAVVRYLEDPEYRE